VAGHLTSEQLDELRKLLIAERDRLRARRGRTPDEELVGEVRDEPDRAATEARWDVELRIGTHERERLAELQAALERMDAGKYGICEETGDPIPFARLRSEPTTRYTVEALEQLEQERKRDLVIDNDDKQEGY
jgi:RNA polymerase-binding protein DksA